MRNRGNIATIAATLIGGLLAQPCVAADTFGGGNLRQLDEVSRKIEAANRSDSADLAEKRLAGLQLENSAHLQRLAAPGEQGSGETSYLEEVAVHLDGYSGLCKSIGTSLSDCLQGIYDTALQAQKPGEPLSETNQIDLQYIPQILAKPEQSGRSPAASRVRRVPAPAEAKIVAVPAEPAGATSAM